MGSIPSPPSSMDITSSEIASISVKIMIATIVLVFLLLLFLFCIHVYVRCYTISSEDPAVVSWRRREARRARPAAVDAQRHGLDPLALRSIPILEYNPKAFKDGLECAVCLSELSQGEKVRILPKCNHGFHVNCIDMWFHSHSTCPLCRNPVIPTQNPSKKPNGVDVQHSDSSSSDDDSDESYASAVNIPANVSALGDRNSSSRASSSAMNRSRDELVIEIPREEFEDCSSSGIWGVGDEEEVKSPVMTRLRSLKRLLSRGKRVAPSPRGSTSAEAEQV